MVSESFGGLGEVGHICVVLVLSIGLCYHDVLVREDFHIICGLLGQIIRVVLSLRRLLVDDIHSRGIRNSIFMLEFDLV